MNNKKFISLLFVMLLISGNTFAQSEQDMEVLKQHAREKVKQLNDYISYMADPNEKESNRNFSKEQAQKLFIENCNPFKEIVEFTDGTKEQIWRKDGVIMEVASLRRRTPRPRPMKEYFRGLINMDYKSVTIESTDMADMRVSKLQPYDRDEKGNLRYVCTVHFEQVFHGVTPEGRKYEDVTRKWVVCYVQVDRVLDETTGQTYPEYMVDLGDVHVESIERLR